MRDLLFEIGTEEIPAGFLAPALSQLQDKCIQKFSELKIGHGEVKVLGTPRRLALIVCDVGEKQDDIKEELLGPSKKAAFDEAGNMTKAAEGFARSKGANVTDLVVVDTPKGEYLMLVREVIGKETAELLPGILEGLIGGLSFRKSMRWGSNLQTFARPIQWLVALLGEDVIRVEHEGILASNQSGGHRFMANERFTITNAGTYEKQLLEKQVIADPSSRRADVVAEIKRAVAESTSVQNGSVAIDENLVDTVTNLVEIPFGVCGVFDEKFLQLPAEVLITSMREHQKYFPVVNSEGDLLPAFVAVNNTRVNDETVTRKGHQRVLRARLEDALFFFNSDRETRLEDRIPKLAGIIFQAKLGTMLEKNDRLIKLSRILAEKIDDQLIENVCRAALLCKTDLLSDMVGEFPSLQGDMGAAYATHDGEKTDVATAIKEHYMPKRSGAEIPSSDGGALLALADRFDTLAGCFGIGLTPTGKADPLGLRRITLAILHIIEEKKYTVSLRDVVQKSLALYGDKVDASSNTVDNIIGFIQGRFVNDCVRRGMDGGAVEAAVSVNFDDINDCLSRISSLSAMKKEPSFGVLAASYKRVKNIIKDNKATEVKADLFEQDVEKDLHDLFLDVRQKMEKFIDTREYTAALKAMLSMKEPVDTFFDQVMVMAEDENVRQNRLNLLTALGELIRQVGDISKMQES